VSGLGHKQLFGRHARHAAAIDERRAWFSNVSWGDLAELNKATYPFERHVADIATRLCCVDAPAGLPFSSKCWA
jgi:hypothetical protein